MHGCDHKRRISETVSAEPGSYHFRRAGWSLPRRRQSRGPTSSVGDAQFAGRWPRLERTAYQTLTVSPAPATHLTQLPCETRASCSTSGISVPPRPMPEATQQQHRRSEKDVPDQMHTAKSCTWTLEQQEDENTADTPSPRRCFDEERSASPAQAVLQGAGGKRMCTQRRCGELDRTDDCKAVRYLFGIWIFSDIRRLRVKRVGSEMLSIAMRQYELAMEELESDGRPILVPGACKGARMLGGPDSLRQCTDMLGQVRPL